MGNHPASYQGANAGDGGMMGILITVCLIGVAACVVAIIRLEGEGE
jgi:hypothetical protein